MEAVEGTVAAVKIKVRVLHGCQHGVSHWAVTGREQNAADGIRYCKDEKQAGCSTARMDAGAYLEYI